MAFDYTTDWRRRLSTVHYSPSADRVSVATHCSTRSTVSLLFGRPLRGWLAVKAVKIAKPETTTIHDHSVFILVTSQNTNYVTHTVSTNAVALLFYSCCPELQIQLRLETVWTPIEFTKQESTFVSDYGMRPHTFRADPLDR